MYLSPLSFKRLSTYLKLGNELENYVNVNDFPTLYEMIQLENKNPNIGWRIQPENATLEHDSMDYFGEQNIKGVWAFLGIHNLIEDLEDYGNQVQQDNEIPEIAAIHIEQDQDGPEGSVIITKGSIVQRFNYETLRNELNTAEEMLLDIDEEYGAYFSIDDLLDFLTH